MTLLKFGNPVILDRLVEPPTNRLELLLQPWPIAWGFILFGCLALVSLVTVRLCSAPAGRSADSGPSAERESPAAMASDRFHWLVWLPLVWLAWQGLSATQTVSGRLTGMVLPHLAVVAGCFYLGLVLPRKTGHLRGFWISLLVLFVLVLMTGFDQHYGGLESTRRHVQSQPGWQDLPAEYLKRVASNRIFATLLYPNTLAGVLLLLLPPLLAALWQLTGRLPRLARPILTGLLGYAGVACLVWSGSKAGWLIALLVGLAWVLQLPFRHQFKLAIMAVVLLAGLTGFFLRYSRYFAAGATSVGARFDYWRAGWQTAVEHPWLGTGPGTFSMAYARLKRPEAEMARLAHNDFLQQASDSGFLGALAFLLFMGGSLAVLYPKSRHEPLAMGTWLGLLGWSFQGWVEFGLYIPALGWTGFFLFGWLWGNVNNFPRKSIDSPRRLR